MRWLGLLLVLATTVAHANGRPPLTNGIHFKPGDPHTMYVASTFGLLISHDDGCTMNWVCEDNLGYGGVWDPKYAIASDGTIFATTFTGLRVSRDGGCSFNTATDSLPAGDPGRIAGIWIDALDIGPTGDVWVGTAESGAPNNVYVSHDNGITFTATGLQSPTVFYKSAKAAASNMMRVYVTGYEVNPPTGHLLHTDNGGATWTPSTLTNVQYGSSPITLVAAVDPTNPDTFYLISEGAMQPSGDILYRSTDAGVTFTQVLASPDPIQNVVIRDAQNVYVVTMTQSGPAFVGGPVYHSTDSGMTYTSMPGEPQLACLGVGPDGNMVGCGANWNPDFEAVARSLDSATTWAKVWRFVELAGPLQCPAGTAEEDTCNQQQWSSLQQQFGTTGPTCGANVVPDAGTPIVPKKAGGCCDSGSAPVGLVWAGAIALWLGRRRRDHKPERQLG